MDEPDGLRDGDRITSSYLFILFIYRYHERSCHSWLNIHCKYEISLKLCQNIITFFSYERDLMFYVFHIHNEVKEINWFWESSIKPKNNRKYIKWLHSAWERRCVSYSNSARRSSAIHQPNCARKSEQYLYIILSFGNLCKQTQNHFQMPNKSLRTAPQLNSYRTSRPPSPPPCRATVKLSHRYTQNWLSIRNENFN